MACRWEVDRIFRRDASYERCSLENLRRARQRGTSGQTSLRSDQDQGQEKNFEACILRESLGGTRLYLHEKNLRALHI